MGGSTPPVSSEGIGGLILQVRYQAPVSATPRQIEYPCPAWTEPTATVSGDDALRDVKAKPRACGRS